MAKKKKRVFKIKNIIILLLLLGILGGGVYTIFVMPVKNVYIHGNEMVTDSEIMNISTLNTYPSFLFTKSSFIREEILKNTYIENVVVKKKFGNIIEIRVEEYKSIALFGERLVLSNGIKLENQYNILDVPILINSPEDNNVYKNFAKKFSKVDANILRQISEIEYSPVEVDNERFLLYMNDGNLVYVTLTKMWKLNKYNRIRDKLGDKKGIIYLDSGDYVELKKDNNSTTGVIS